MGGIMGKILIIDKKTGDLERFHDELKSKGYDILKASTDEEGIKVVNENDSLELIILGMETGADEGFRLLQNLRKINTDIPILLNCEHTDFKKDFKSWLADDYMTKTSGIETLESKIEELLKR